MIFTMVSLSLMVFVSRLYMVCRMVGVNGVFSVGLAFFSSDCMSTTNNLSSLSPSTKVLLTMSLRRPLMWSTTFAWFSVWGW